MTTSTNTSTNTSTCTDAGLPERFPLTKQSSQDGIQAIHNLTSGKINLLYITKMLETIQKRKHTWSSFLVTPLDPDLIKQIIGKDGLHFKKFTTKYGLDLIWHDRESNRFLLWGPKLGVISALYALKRHIKRFTIKYEEGIKAMLCLNQTLHTVRLRADDDDDNEEQPRQKKIKCD